MPTDQDILHIRVRTTGLTKVNVQIENHSYQVYDVGGERSERRKWVSVMDDASFVLIFVPMSGFDEALFEDAAGVSQLKASHTRPYKS